MAAIPLGVWLRYDYSLSGHGSRLVVPLLVAVGLQGVFGCALGLYRRRWRYGSFDEVRIVALTAALVGLSLTVLNWVTIDVPRSVPVVAIGLSVLGQIATRSMWRAGEGADQLPGVRRRHSAA